MKIFKRYSSTIHGNYRKAYLRCGLIVGVLMSLYLLIRNLMGAPAQSPVSLVSDAILLVSVFLFAAYYRNSLPERKVTLKELMLFGMGLAAVAGLVYGLFLWVILSVDTDSILRFVPGMTGREVDPNDPQMHYWAPFIAIVSAIETLLLGAFGAFLASILLKNEKPEIKNKR